MIDYDNDFDLMSILIDIEKRIGILDTKDPTTITGELSNLRKYASIRPFVEIELPIDGDKFIVKKTPIKVGDSALVNGHGIISMAHNDATIIEEWRGISFEGKVGTIEGSNNKYHGKTISVSYFYSDTRNFGVSISDGFIESVEVDSKGEDIIIPDLNSNKKIIIYFDWNGLAQTKEYVGTKSINNIVEDKNTNKKYALIARDGAISYMESIDV